MSKFDSRNLAPPQPEPNYVVGSVVDLNLERCRMGARNDFDAFDDPGDASMSTRSTFGDLVNPADLGAPSPDLLSLELLRGSRKFVADLAEDSH